MSSSQNLETVRASEAVISAGGGRNLLTVTLLGKDRGIHRYPGLSFLPSSAFLPWLPLAKHSWSKETIGSVHIIRLPGQGRRGRRGT